MQGRVGAGVKILNSTVGKLVLSTIENEKTLLNKYEGGIEVLRSGFDANSGTQVSDAK